MLRTINFENYGDQITEGTNTPCLPASYRPVREPELHNTKLMIKNCNENRHKNTLVYVRLKAMLVFIKTQINIKNCSAFVT